MPPLQSRRGAAARARLRAYAGPICISSTPNCRRIANGVIPGHQIVGDVAATGDGVDAALKGRRVGVSWLGGTDGTCEQCLAGT